MREHGAESTEQKAASERTAPCSVLRISCSLLLFAVIAVVGFVPIAAGAQTPTASQVQQALAQQPGLGDVLRSRIRESGLTPEQIRARLSASGYPATLLDAYLGTTAEGAPTPGSQQLAALQALGRCGWAQGGRGRRRAGRRGTRSSGLRAGFERLCDDVDERGDLIQKGWAREFTWQRSASMTADVYRAFLGAGSGEPASVDHLTT